MKVIVVNVGGAFRRQATAVRQTARRLGRLLHCERAAVEIYLVGDSFMEKNVLAFPTPPDFPRPDLKKLRYLGELYLNPDCIERRGEELTAMLVHGFLHLLGYDHTIKRERTRMERQETVALRALRERR